MSRIAVVAGATSGIGYEVVNKLHRASVDATGFGSNYDVRDIDRIKDFASIMNVEDAELLIYSSGITGLNWIRDSDSKTMLDMMAVNTTGLLNFISAFKRATKLVVIGSIAGEKPLRASSSYCTSKAALHMLTRCISKEMPNNLQKVHLVIPSMVDGGMSSKVDDEVMRVRGWISTNL